MTKPIIKLDGNGDPLPDPPLARDCKNCHLKETCQLGRMALKPYQREGYSREIAETCMIWMPE